MGFLDDAPHLRQGRRGQPIRDGSTVNAAPGFPLTDEAVAFAATIDDLLSKHAGSSELRDAWDAPQVRVPGLWKRLEEVGFFELAAAGRSSLPTLVPAVVITGRRCLPEPIIGTLAANLLGHPTVEVVAAALGDGQLVVDAALAGLVLTAEGLGEVARVEAVDSIDPAARLGRLESSGDLDVAALLAAAQLQGLAEGLLSQASEYAKIREQFGKPIGAFQAVKHQLADVYIEVGFSRPLLDEAARALAVGEVNAGVKVSHAKVAASSAAQLAARAALQVHGGIGYTYEHDLHMWTKKVWTLSRAWGDVRWHRSRIVRDVVG